jgi:putative transposase
MNGGLGVGELRRLKQLEDKNRQLKRLVADLSLDKHILQDVLSKRSLRPDRRREIARYVQSSHADSERRGCAVLTFDRRSILSLSKGGRGAKRFIRMQGAPPA